jgi:hypothetical protein
MLMLLIGVPVGIVACLVRPALTKLVLCVLVWATCEPNMVGINFVSREFYRANTRGFEITLADLCTLILMGFMLLKRKEYPIRWMPPLTLPTFAYLLVGIISWTMAGPSLAVPPEAVKVPYAMFEVGLYPLFELLKIVRGFILYWVIVNFIRDEKAARALLLAVGLTMLYMAYLTVSSRYLYGINRVQATLGHPNSLSTYMAMLGSFAFAFVIQSSTLFSSAIFGFLTLLCTVSVILTISRGGLGALFVGLWLNTMVLLPRYLSLKNMALIVLSVLMVGMILFAAMDTLMNRFAGEQDAGADLAYRGLYNEQAKLMVKDKTFGVGLGNFSAWSWSRYAEQVDPDLPPGTPAHNNWYLTLGELGMPGVITLAIFWLRYFVLALPFYFRPQKNILSTMAMAACTAVIVDHIQSLLQLGYRQTPMFFMMMIFVGLTVAGWYARREQRSAQTLAVTP